MKPARPLDYNRAQRLRMSLSQRRLVIAACCFGTSWLAWLGIAVVEPFDDLGFLGRAGFFVLGPGTLCGAILYACVLVGMLVRHLATRRRESAS